MISQPSPSAFSRVSLHVLLLALGAYFAKTHSTRQRHATGNAFSFAQERSVEANTFFSCLFAINSGTRHRNRKFLVPYGYVHFRLLICTWKFCAPKKGGTSEKSAKKTGLKEKNHQRSPEISKRRRSNEVLCSRVQKGFNKIGRVLCSKIHPCNP